MKTTKDTSLVVFVSFVSIVYLTRCGAKSILDDRDKETEELEALVRKEVFTSLQFLDEDDDTEVVRNGQRGSSHVLQSNANGGEGLNSYYILSNPNSNSGNLQSSENASYKTPPYTSHFGGSSSQPAGNNGAPPFGKYNRNSNLQFSGPAENIRRFGDTSKTARSTDDVSSAPSAMNTREPDDYSTTITLPSIGGVRRMFYGNGGSGGYSGGGAGGGYSSGSGGGYSGAGLYNGIIGTGLRFAPTNLIRRGVRRLRRYGDRYGIGGNGVGYGLAGALLGGASGAGGVGGSGSGAGYYYSNGQDGGISLNGIGGGGRQGYYGNGRYGLQTGNYDGNGGSGASWTLNGGGDVSPNDYYNLRYGYPGGGSSNAALSVDGTGGGSRQYTLSYPSDTTSSNTATISTGSDNGNPPQYELMFLKDPSESSNRRIQSVLNGDSADLSVSSTDTQTGVNRDTSSNGGGGYRINISGSSAGAPSASSSMMRRNGSAGPNGVEEYRVVVVNKDSPGNGSGVTLSTSGSAPNGSGSGSWSVSSSGAGGSSSGRGGQGAFQITTPITSTQVSIPPTSIVGSVLSSVQSAASGDQTRSLSINKDSPGGKIIQVIPVKTS